MRRALSFVAILLAASAAHAQLTETIEVQITNVDVVVTDRAGNPVAGLTADDFEIREGGKPQKITNFYEIRGDRAVAPDGERALEVPAEVPAEVSRRRVVIFVDNHSIHPFARNTAFAALERSLDELLREGDEAMVVFWNRRPRLVSPFTADRAELLRKLKQAASESGPGTALLAERSRVVDQAIQLLRTANSGSGRGLTPQQAYEQSLNAASVFAESLFAVERALIADVKQTLSTLGGLDGKKAIIYLGAELAENPAVDVFEQIDGIYAASVPISTPAVMRESDRSLARDLREIARAANANNVTLYMVDTADRGAQSDPSALMSNPGVSFISATNTPMAMANLASLTGGLAVAGGTQFERALGTIVDDLSSYYSLGYRSPEGRSDYRRMSVTVKRPGLRVRSRSSYVPRDTDEEVRDRVLANLFSGDVKSDFAVNIAAAEPRRKSRGQYEVDVTVTFPSTLTLLPDGDEIAGEFAVYVAAGKNDVALSDVSKTVQPMRFPASAEEAIAAQGTFTYKTTVIVSRGEQVLSVGVADTVGGTSGYARASIEAR